MTVEGVWSLQDDLAQCCDCGVEGGLRPPGSSRGPGASGPGRGDDARCRDAAGSAPGTLPTPRHTRLYLPGRAPARGPSRAGLCGPPCSSGSPPPAAPASPGTERDCSSARHRPDGGAGPGGGHPRPPADRPRRAGPIPASRVSPGGARQIGPSGGARAAHRAAADPRRR